MSSETEDAERRLARVEDVGGETEHASTTVDCGDCGDAVEPRDAVTVRHGSTPYGAARATFCPDCYDGPLPGETTEDA